MTLDPIVEGVNCTITAFRKYSKNPESRRSQKPREFLPIYVIYGLHASVTNDIDLRSIAANTQ